MNRLIDNSFLGYDSVSLEITSICNFKCVYCPMSREDILSGIMPKEKAYKAIDDIKKYIDKVGHIELNLMGEPFIHPHLNDIIEYAKGKNIKVRLITNGSLLSKDVLPYLSGCVLKISLETLDEKCFNYLRGTKIKFDNYIFGIVSFINKAKDYPDATIQLDILYLKHALAKQLAGILPDNSFINCIYRSKYPLFNDVLGFLGKVTKVDKDLLSRNFGSGMFENKKVLYKISDNIILYLKEYYNWVSLKSKLPIQNELSPCLVSKFGIKFNGDVVLCCNDYNGSTSMGNIFKEDISGIFGRSKKTIDSLRKGIFTYDTCKRCKGYYSKRHRLIRKVRQLVGNVL